MSEVAVKRKKKICTINRLEEENGGCPFGRKKKSSKGRLKRADKLPAEGNKTR